MARMLSSRFTNRLPCLLSHISNKSNILRDSSVDNVTQQLIYRVGHPASFQVSRSYARGKPKVYNLFGKGAPGSKQFGKSLTKKIEEEAYGWSESEDEVDSENLSPVEKKNRKVKQKAEEHSEDTNADDSDEQYDIWSGSDEEKTLWAGCEEDSDHHIPTEAYTDEKSDAYIDKLFEFEEDKIHKSFPSFLEALMPQHEPEELSPGKNARKLAVENALKKLRRGPDGRYVNVWEVCSDLDILIGAFENIISGPEYAELRAGGPKKLNMAFFKDIQAKMRDPNYKWTPELKLKPKTKTMSKKRWQKAENRRLKDLEREMR